MLRTGADARQPLGQIALHQSLGLSVPPPVVQSYAGSGARRTRGEDALVEEHYPADYRTDGSLKENIRFALRYEPLDLRVLIPALEALGETELGAWVRSEPTGAYSRRAWFFYEKFTGRTIDVENTSTGNYVDALNEKVHFTCDPIRSKRQRVSDNTIGNANLCPTVRRTVKLENMIAQRLDLEAQAIANSYSPDTLARAVSFLYSKETRSSFAIEGEAPSQTRVDRFLYALHRAPDFNPCDKEELVRLQGSIVEPRYAARDWRDDQNFVGEATHHFGENVHFVSPRPEDVPLLMDGWMKLTERCLKGSLDPVIAAAVSSFSFVFIHPFDDGNGRIHRFMIHLILSRRQFSRQGVIFPVSAAILRQRYLYDIALQAFSRPTMIAIDWEFIKDNAITVKNDTRNLYRFFDATQQAEFLYDRVAETIRIDLKEELDFLEIYDQAYIAVREIVDMPDRRASLLVRLSLQNGGRLSKAKRHQFPELEDHEIELMEKAVQTALNGDRPA